MTGNQSKPAFLDDEVPVEDHMNDSFIPESHDEKERSQWRRSISDA